MNRFTRLSPLVLALALALTGWAVPAAAQGSSISQADIQRLQYAVSDARTEVSNLRGRDSALADRLQTQLDDLSDEVIYLKVRSRKEQNVPRGEYSSLRDRIEQVRSQARAGVGSGSGTTSGESGRSTTGGQRTTTGGTTSGTRDYPTTGTTTNRTGDWEQSRTGTSGSENVRRSAPNEIPVGQELDVRLQTRLNSGTAAVEDRFEATTLVDLYQDDRVLVPAGSVLRGVVSSVNPAGRMDRKGSLTVAFDQLTVNGRSYPIRATVTQALESEGIKGETGKIAAGAGVGAIIGGILGGFKGALAGILIGGGGTIAATEGKDVDLPVGTVLRIRFDSAVTVR